MSSVKARRRTGGAARRKGTGSVAVTRISGKNQTTLPVAVLHRAGLGTGDQVRVEAVGAGRILLTRATAASERFAGCLTGVYGRGYLTRLRREWR
jgi:bifunctional DNA-binding transcriptional regulator/antitoxin component of YhaV-PrlF toxin-antitoxin module